MKYANKLMLIALLAVPIIGNAADTDNDGIDDTVDNCQFIANQGQEDTDRDFFGNACDADLNNDGIVNTLDIGQLRKSFGKSDNDYDFNPDADLNSDGIVNTLDVGRLRSLFGKAPGPRGMSPAELDPPTVTVDLNEQPSIATLPGIDGGSTRQLVKLTSSSDANNNLEFTANEVILSTSDITEKDAFLNRWNATVIASFNIDKIFPNTNIPNPVITYVINVDPSTADTTQLNSDLPKNDQYMHGAYKVSSVAGQKILALVASERVNNDLDISLNIRFKSNHVLRRNSIESMTGDAGPNSPGGGIFPYTDNAFLWPYLEYNPDLNPSTSYFPLDTGVSEAWRILWGAGINGSPFSPKVLILDAGFIPNYDLQWDSSLTGPFYVPNPDNCGAATQTPACKWHGTHVAMSGFAWNTNNFGAAGPGAPVSSNLNVVNSPGDVGSFIVYLAHDLPASLLAMPRIINMSFSIDIHEVLWWLSGAEALNRFMTGFEVSNMLVVAAAGNHGKNLDSDEYRTIPCELRFVFCVGATNFGNPRRADFSNYGNRSVDIFAPGVLWSVDAEQADWANTSIDDHLSIITGTSFAAPFVSGVAALILAADPNISSAGIRSILKNSAHTYSPDPNVHRHINALAAIKPLLGNTVPYISFTTTDGSSYTAGSGRLDYEYADLDGDTVTITWQSNVDGSMGTRNTTVPANTKRVSGNISLAGLSPGTHTIRIIISDNGASGNAAGTIYDEIEVTIVNPLPTVEILQPTQGQTFFLSSTIPLRASSHDANTPTGPGPLPDDQMVWFANLGFVGIAQGHSANISATRLGLGAHSIRLQGFDQHLSHSNIDTVSITIIADPINLPPSISIISPIHPTNLGYSTTSQKVYLDFTVVDPEGDSVSWNWYSRVNGGSKLKMFVQSEQQCSFWLPINLGGGCASWVTRYYTILDHVAAFTSYTLILEARDEHGNTGTAQEVTVTMNTFG